jgi:hypothetical protein
MERKFLGHVGVDSGQLMIIDPCYIDGFWEKNEKPIGMKSLGSRTKRSL